MSRHYSLSPPFDGKGYPDIEQLALATKQLSQTQQEVISLRFAGGLSIAEVAKVVGKSQGAVKALQHSAILNLRKILIGGTIQ